MSHLIVPAIPFDGGKSGISSYILSTLSKISDKHELTVYTLAQDSAQIEKVLKGKYTLRKVPNYLGRPVLNMLWHLVVLPFLLMFEKGEGIFLPAGNRRVMSFYPKPTVVTVHDLSQFHVPAKYDIFRMFYIYQNNYQGQR